MDEGSNLWLPKTQLVTWLCCLALRFWVQPAQLGGLAAGADLDLSCLAHGLGHPALVGVVKARGTAGSPKNGTEQAVPPTSSTQDLD